MGIANGQVLQLVRQPRQGDPIGALGRQEIAGYLRHATVTPLEKAARLVDGINDVGHLQRLSEEMLVDEQVMVR